MVCGLCLCIPDAPNPSERVCAFFVREAFPSVDTDTELTDGLITEALPLAIMAWGIDSLLAIAAWVAGIAGSASPSTQGSGRRPRT